MRLSRTTAALLMAALALLTGSTTPATGAAPAGAAPAGAAPAGAVPAGAAPATATAATKAAAQAAAQYMTGYVTVDDADTEPGTAGINTAHLHAWMHYLDCCIFLQVYGNDFTLQGLRGLEAYVNTVDANPGPEYRIHAYSPRDSDGLRMSWVARVENWGGTGTRVSCPALELSWRIRARYVQVQVPRRCLGNPRAIRVNTETWRYTQYRGGLPSAGTSDPAPGWHTWSKWLT